MNINDLLAQIEVEFPDMEWLIRNGGDDLRGNPGRCFAHIFDPDSGMGEDGYLVSFYAYRDHPMEALQAAFDAARAAQPRAA